ncbi:hypothetical protein [Mucilaginibacter antarcticus]|uniref:Flp pilus assembly protein CpaB n=1 Tax=Mucilaginibacter antarcticus TaxID=1855725 RepID=A0ABW5XLJ5_9SPHI
MLKVVLTAAIVLSVGILSLIKTTTPEKTAPVQLEKVAVGSRIAVLATAD